MGTADLVPNKLSIPEKTTSNQNAWLSWRFPSIISSDSSDSCRWLVRVWALHFLQAMYDFIDECIQALADQGFDGLAILISKRVELVDATKIPATQAVCIAYLDHLMEVKAWLRTFGLEIRSNRASNQSRCVCSFWRIDHISYCNSLGKMKRLALPWNGWLHLRHLYALYLWPIHGWLPKS